MTKTAQLCVFFCAAQAKTKAEEEEKKAAAARAELVIPEGDYMVHVHIIEVRGAMWRDWVT